MNPPTAKDVILDCAPVEHRAEYARCLDRLSRNPNDPFFVVFSIMMQSYRSSTADLASKLADAEEREKQVAAQQAKGQAETQQTVQHEIGKLGQDQFWKRVVRSKIAGGITFAVCWVLGSYWLINTQIGAVKSSVDQLKADQVATLEAISKKPQGIVDFANASLKAADKSNDTAAMLAGIAAMLSTPDATMGVRDGKLIIKINSKDIEIKQEGEYTKLQIYQKVPRVLDTIEDHLDEADAALQE